MGHLADVEVRALRAPIVSALPFVLGCFGAALLGAGAVAIAGRVATAPPVDVLMAGFSTSLQGRTPSQRHNVRLAVESLSGAQVLPGGELSFNRTVRSWSHDRGYVKAPVSYGGELVPAFGGGVCQVSTTLYCAALRAGLEIVERHPHAVAPRYVAPGLDAAVAQTSIDLRVRNPYPFPVRILARLVGTRLDIRIHGRHPPSLEARMEVRRLSRNDPVRITRTTEHGRFDRTHRYVRSPGATGYRVVVHRVFVQRGREVRRERLSDDTYAAMDRVVAVQADG